MQQQEPSVLSLPHRIVRGLAVLSADETGWGHQLWLALLVAASAAFSFVFACATPFAAFAAAAALTLSRRDALRLTVAVWLANQVLGYADIASGLHGVRRGALRRRGCMARRNGELHAADCRPDIFGQRGCAHWPLRSASGRRRGWAYRPIHAAAVRGGRDCLGPKARVSTFTPMDSLASGQADCPRSLNLPGVYGAARSRSRGDLQRSAAHDLEFSCGRGHARHGFARALARRGRWVPCRRGSSSDDAENDGQRSVARREVRPTA